MSSIRTTRPRESVSGLDRERGIAHISGRMDQAKSGGGRMSEQRHGFQAEVSRLLEIVAHSLYSDKAVFLRELISNASDACDRLRYLALTQPDLGGDGQGYRVTLAPDKAGRQLGGADNGIGMNHGDLVENLGTIARSGTAAFMKQMTGDAAKDMALIGQFGVGFYSAFMVADKVVVES